MDKKNKSDIGDSKGFEEFIEGQSKEPDLQVRPLKKEATFENTTFLANDSLRLMKLKNLLIEKAPFSASHEQGDQLAKEQLKEIQNLKSILFEIFQKPDSAYLKSMSEVFDNFFEPPSI